MACSLMFFFISYGYHRDLHSFPTRRSSDLEPLRFGGQRIAFPESRWDLSKIPGLGGKLSFGRDVASRSAGSLRRCNLLGLNQKSGRLRMGSALLRPQPPTRVEQHRFIAAHNYHLKTIPPL